ncbi:MAG: hypothetical protein PHP62_04535 [Candidatus Moranbacteria bacterium]|nr:hypothetical protein [Candidatus Moranbacteria bacterium]
MERGPNLNVVGKINDKVKDEIRQDNHNNLHKQLEQLTDDQRVDVLEHECPKSPEELICIDLANQETNRLLELSGVESYDFPATNVHIFDEYFIKEQYGSDFETGRAYAEGQSIILSEDEVRNNKIGFASIVFHEMFHVKSLFVQHAVRKQEEDETFKTRITTYRKGLLVCSPQPKHDDENEEHVHFAGLNEAVTAQAEKIFFGKLLNNQLFADERKKLYSEEVVAFKSELFKDKGITEDEIIFVSDKNNGKREYLRIGYAKQREVLEYVCREIAQDLGVSEEEVFNKFVKSQFNGHLVELGNMIEKSFGKGSFRRLGDMPRGQDYGPETLEALRKMRLQILKAR